VRLIIWRK